MGNEISKCLSWQYNTSFRRAVSSQAGGANVKIQAPPGAVAVARIWRRWMQRAGLAPRAGGRCPSLRMGDAIKLFPFFPCAQMYLHREVSYFYCKKNWAYCWAALHTIALSSGESGGEGDWRRKGWERPVLTVEWFIMFPWCVFMSVWPARGWGWAQVVVVSFLSGICFYKCCNMGAGVPPADGGSGAVEPHAQGCISGGRSQRFHGQCQRTGPMPRLSQGKYTWYR